MGNVFEKAVKILPTFFESKLGSGTAGLFDSLKQVIDFDEAYICFLNSDSFNVKYSFAENSSHLGVDNFSISNKLKKDLFSTRNVLLGPENELVKTLGVDKYQSFLVSKLIIQGTVFGFVLLCKSKAGFYSDSDVTVSKALGAVVSYKIKDIELSEVFNIQIKALAQSIVDTKKANQKIVEADKIKTEFLANISHELRTPLNAIIGFSEMLSTQLFGPLNEKQADYIHDINVSGIHLLGMINEVLDISKIEAKAMTLNPSEFMISVAVDEVVNIVKSIADKKHVVIKKNIIDGNVTADFQKIRQILYNLLSNAIKFSPENDSVLVNACVTKDDFVISIRDNGIGIGKKNHIKIFEKFVQLDNTYTKKESSTGLGLTITKEFVEMHKGRISVESSIGKGATFTVTIPLS